MMELQLDNLLREVQKLHGRNELSKSIGADYFEPGMMEYLDQSDGSFDRSSGSLLLRFEARGTRYDGRTEVIENVHLGDPLQIVRDRENPFNSNNFTLLTGKNKNVGNMPAELCNVLAPFYDEGTLLIRNAEVSYVEPISRRNRHAKQAVLFVSLEADVRTLKPLEAETRKSGPDEETVVAALQKHYPDRVIFPEEYNTKKLGVMVHLGVYQLAKEAGLSRTQWLEQQGFQWRETGFVEADMQERDREIVRTGAVELCDSILRKYPLVGQYEPSDEEFRMLLFAAEECVRKICRPGTSLTRGEELILTVATVQLLKKRNADEQDETQDESLWNYIYQQYGFNPENSKTAQQRVYKSFCTAIKGTLELYHRFLAPPNTMRYYTSLLLHAIAPKASIDSLFEILFGFYVERLDFQYMSDDPGYKTLVKGMQARWNNADAEIRLKSDAVMSGLKTLFLERPGYMAVLCDKLVETIDRLLRGETIEIRDRWDQLLADWYQKKSSIERSRFQGQKREHRTEYVATTTERILVQYRMEDGKVGISVPRIRLSETGETRPTLTILQGGQVIYHGVLSATGDDLCLTTRRKFVPLEETDLDFSKELEICVSIHYLGRELFNSAEKLHRDVVCFDSEGMERAPKKGIAFLFAADSQEFYFSDESAVTMENHLGQLYRVNLGTVGTVTANGMEVFADEEQTNKPRLYPSFRPVQGIELCREGKNYRIFSEPFSLRVHIPEADNPLRYQLSLDGQRLEEQKTENHHEYIVELPALPGMLHTVRLVDLVQSVSAIEASFIILPGFIWETEKAWYLETENEVNLTLSMEGKETSLTAFRDGESNIGTAQDGSGRYSYELEIPTVSCRLGERSAFLLPNRLWHEEIGKVAFAYLSLPTGWQGRLMLGTESIPENADGMFELGNYLQSGKCFEATETLWLSLLPKDRKTEHLRLTELCFTPTFSEPPIEITEEAVLWQPESKYLGGGDPHFRLRISRFEDPFSVTLEKKQLALLSLLKNGRYHYRVYLQSGGLFSRGQEALIYESDFIVGGENYARFEGMELVLKNAIYWDFQTEELITKDAESGAGILSDLEYIEDSVPSGETLALPRYRATMFFETWDGRRIPFSSEYSAKYELVNPVSVWIVNERNMILQNPDWAGLDFDIGAARIVSKNRDSIMTKAMQEKRIKTPDYYGYEMRKRRDV